MVPISGSSFKDPKIVHSKQFEMKEPQPYREQVVCVGWEVRPYTIISSLPWKANYVSSMYAYGWYGKRSINLG